MRVLLVDDDVELLDVTAYALKRSGFSVLTASTGAEAIRRWQREAPDVIVTDVRLPDLGGFDICRTVRERSSTPVIMLTALSHEDEIARGFHAGADDYVTKPFSPRLLVLRIEAICRRAAVAPQAKSSGHLMRNLRLGDLELDVEAHDIRFEHTTVRLTPKEFRLLYILVSNTGRVVQADRLVEYAWGYDDGDSVLIRTHLSRLRQKLHSFGRPWGQIQAASGVGYRYTPPQSTRISR